MDKDDLLQLLNDARIKEEEAIPIYAEHISAALHWSGFPEDQRKEILEKLELLETESKFHAEALNKVIQIIMNE